MKLSVVHKPPLTRAAIVALPIVLAGILASSCGAGGGAREAGAVAPSISTSSTTTTLPPPDNSAVLDDVVSASAIRKLPATARLRGAAGDHAILYDNGCHLTWGGYNPSRKCVFGDKTSETVVVIMGDSHAAHWFGGFEEAATTNGWKLVTVTKSGCPAADVTVYSQAKEDKGKKVVYKRCDQWRKNAFEFIKRLEPDVIVFPTLTRRGIVGAGGKSALPLWRKGFKRSHDALASTGAAFIIMGDTPQTRGRPVPSCLSANKRDITKCANSRSKAVYEERLAMLAKAARDIGAVWVDVSNWICGPKICPVVIGDRVVYRDDHHLTDAFARYRAPLIAEAVSYALWARDRAG